MTKFMWFQISSIIFIFSALVGVCIAEDILVSTSLDNVAQYCYQIEKAVEENDGIVNNKVNFWVENLEYNWQNNESSLCYLVNHKNMQEIGVEITRLKNYIEEDERTEFLISLELIKYYSQAYRHFMGASFHNIL